VSYGSQLGATHGQSPGQVLPDGPIQPLASPFEANLQPPVSQLGVVVVAGTVVVVGGSP
jgi:hypothetical protein